MRKRFEKGDDRGKGGDVRGGGAGFERCEVNVPVVNGNEYVSKSRHFQPTPVQTIDKTVNAVNRCEEVRKNGCEEREHEILLVSPLPSFLLVINLLVIINL